jgi:hypothetical protein
VEFGGRPTDQQRIADCCVIMDEINARKIALAHLKQLELGSGLKRMLVDRDTIERPFGWVSFYDQRHKGILGTYKPSSHGMRHVPHIVRKRPASSV